MASIKISDLTLKSTMAGTEEILINDSGTSKKMTTQPILDAQTAAETAQTAAETAQTAAESAQTAAESAESTATTKAGEASTSATAAASSATSAASAQTAAESARDATLTAYDNFDDRYLGTKSSDPTLDNDSNALVAGALYFNTTDEEMKVYTGSAWVAAYVSGSGVLLIANNLSDLDNDATARTNLGVAIGTDVQAYSSVLQNTTASFTTADETKLDGIETGADVTDTTNVVAALTAGTNITIAGDGTISATDTDTGILNVVEDTTPQLGGNLDTNGNDINFGDNDKAQFGASNDLQIYHDGSNSYITDTGTGNLFIRGSANVQIEGANGENMIYCNENGAVALYNNNSIKLATTSTGIDVTGNVAVSGTVDGRDVATDGTKLDGIESGATADQTKADIDALGINAATLDGVDSSQFLRSDADTTKTAGSLNFNDGIAAKFGNSLDLLIYHDGTHSYIADTGTGNLRLTAQNFYVMDTTATKTMFAGVQDAQSVIYYNGSQKLETTSTGVNVTGTITADGLDMEDNQQIKLGTSDDLLIYHNGTHSYIQDNGTGNLKLRGTNVNIESNDGELFFGGTANAQVNLYYNNVNKFNTTNEGVYVAGRSTGTQTTDNDGNFNLQASNHFVCTPSANFTLTFTNHTAGQAGTIVLKNTGGYTVSAHADTLVMGADLLTTISTAGTYVLGYISDGTDTRIYNSGAQQ